MAICKYCRQDMLKATGCNKIPVVYNKREYNPIKVGDVGDMYFGYDENTTCKNCGAHMGHYHHPGCDMERCPVCGEQLISCDCMDDED